VELQLLSRKSLFGNNQFGVLRCEPRGFFAGEFAQTVEFVLVRPHDQVFAGGCAAVIDPALLHPIVDFYGNDFELAGEIGNPPLILFEEFILKQFSKQPQAAREVRDAGLRKDATSAGTNPSRFRVSAICAR
jgi:hypothetical protein